MENLVFLIASDEITKIFRNQLCPYIQSKEKYNADGDRENSQISFQRDIDPYKSVTWTFKRPTDKFFNSAKNLQKNFTKEEDQVS